MGLYFLEIADMQLFFCLSDDNELHSLRPISPFLKGQLNGLELPVSNIVIVFNRGETFRKEGTRVKL